MMTGTEAVQQLNISTVGENSAKIDTEKIPVIRGKATVRKARVAKIVVKKTKPIKPKYTKQKKAGDKEVKRMQVIRTPLEKVCVLDYLIEPGATKAKASRLFHVPESTIRGWVGEEGKLRREAAEALKKLQSLGIANPTPATPPSTPPSTSTTSPNSVPPLWVLANCVAPVRTTSDVPIRSLEQLNEWMDDKIAEFRQASAIMQFCNLMHGVPL